MIKNKAILEVKIGERIYAMECYSDSPLGEVHDALSQMKQFVIERMKQAETAQNCPEGEDSSCHQK